MGTAHPIPSDSQVSSRTIMMHPRMLMPAMAILASSVFADQALVTRLAREHKRMVVNYPPLHGRRRLPSKEIFQQIADLKLVATKEELHKTTQKILDSVSDPNYIQHVFYNWRNALKQLDTAGSQEDRVPIRISDNSDDIRADWNVNVS